MAQTVSRVVQLQIKLEGAKSIQELEQVTQEINSELKQLDKNSQNFNKMASLAKKANSSIKETAQSLEGVTSTEKAEAVNKLGQGMVGAFQAAAGASLLFGEKTSEELQKVIQKVGGLFAITDGLKKVTEAFSAKNIAGLKAVAKGFQQSSIAAKLFGTTTKAAITATGIGLIVIILASIIANFDKVKKAISNAFNKIKDAFPFLEKIQNFIDDIKERFGSLGNIIKGVGAAIASIFTKQTMKEAFTEAIDEAKELQKFQEESKKLLGERKDVLEDTLAIMQEEGKTQDELIKKQKEYNDEVIKLYENRKDLSDEEKKALDNAIQGNKILDIRLKNYQKETAEKAKQKSLDDARKKIQDELSIATAKRAILEGKLAKTLVEVETALSKIYADEELAIRGIEKTRDETVSILDDEIDKLEEVNELTNVSIQNGLLQKKNLDNYINKLVDLKEKSEAIQPPTDESLALYNILEDVTAEYHKQNQLIIDANEFIKQYEKGNDRIIDGVKVYNGIIVSMSLEEKERLVTLEGQKKVLEQSNNLRLTEIQAQGQINSKLVETNQAELISLEAKQNLLNSQLAINKAAQAEVGILILNAKTDVEKYQLKKELIDLQLKEAEIDRQKIENTSTEEKILVNINDLHAENNKLQAEAVGLGENIVEVEKQQAEIIAKNADVYVNKWQKATIQVKNFFKKNGEDMAESLDTWNQALQQTLEFMAVLDERRAEMAQRDLDAYIENNEAKYESDKELADKLEDDNKDLQALLADAEGERYDDILEKIKQNDEAKAVATQNAIDYEKQVALMQYEVEKANWEAAKKRKTASIIDAIISTALGVVKALPNIFLAAAVGILGAAGIATIAAQPLPPEPKKPEFAIGGYTGDGAKDEVAGVVHKGEYVVPARVVKKNQAQGMLESLERMRVKGFAEGGTVSIPNIPDVDTSLDYARIGDEVARALKENPMFVSWVGWRDINARMQWIGNRAGFGRD